MRNFNLILAAILGIALMTACGSSKNTVKKGQASLEEQRAEIALERERMLLDKEKKEIAYEQRKMEMEQKRDIKRLEQEERSIIIPCEKESYDGEGYMAGLGIAEDVSKSYGMSEALKRAKAEIMNKFMGAFKVGIEEYTKSTTVASGDKRDMAKIEGGVKSAGQEAINKYSRIVCRSAQENPNNLSGVDVYIVVHVSTGDVKKEIASRLETLEVDYNADKFFEGLDSALEDQKKYEDDALNRMNNHE